MDIGPSELAGVADESPAPRRLLCFSRQATTFEESGTRSSSSKPNVFAQVTVPSSSVWVEFFSVQNPKSTPVAVEV